MLGKILEKNQVILFTTPAGDGQYKGKKFELFTAMNCASGIKYRGETFCYS